MFIFERWFYGGTFDDSQTSRMPLPGSLGANQRTVPEQRDMRSDGRDLPRPSALVTDSVQIHLNPKEFLIL